MKSFIKLAQELVDKLEEIGKSKEYVGVFQLAQVHGCPYTGPTYEKELNALREALSDLKTSLLITDEELVAKLLSDPDYSLSTIWPEEKIKSSCICGPGVHKAEDEQPAVTLLYFNDYSEDAAMPSSGNRDLVHQYKELMDRQSKPIEIFDSRDDLYNFISEVAHQARDGIHGFKEYSEAEMLELINEAK